MLSLIFLEHCVHLYMHLYMFDNKVNFFLQFVYLRDNLLSTLDGVEVLKRVKVHTD